MLDANPEPPPWGSLPGRSTRTACNPQHGSATRHVPAMAVPGTLWLSQAPNEEPSPASLTPTPPRAVTHLGPSPAGEARQDQKRQRGEEDPQGLQRQAWAVSSPAESALQQSLSPATPQTPTGPST